MQKSGGAVIHMQSNFELLEFSVGDRFILEQMPGLPVGEPFSKERAAFLNRISEILLQDPEVRLYPDVATFAFWIRTSALVKMEQHYMRRKDIRVGRGVVFHIAPSNVAVNYAYSFAAGFILGNANIVRLPSKRFVQTDIIGRAILEALQRPEFSVWKNYFVFLRYARNRDVNDYLSKMCDVRVIWGGDHAVNEIRKSTLRPRAGEVTFSDRYSICVIDAAEYLVAEDKEKIALGFYNDTYLMDQNACTSPRLVCWMGVHSDIQNAKRLFWDKLHDEVEKKYNFQPVQYVDKFTNYCLAAEAIGHIHAAKMKDNQIVCVELRQLDSKIQEYRGDSGFFYEYDLNDIMELAPFCNEKVQTVACLGNKDIFLPLIKSGIKGIDRIVEIGKTMDFGLLWDGYDLTERLTRGVYISGQ